MDNERDSNPIVNPDRDPYLSGIGGNSSYHLQNLRSISDS